jgi:hypothetical protein
MTVGGRPRLTLMDDARNRFLAKNPNNPNKGRRKT